MSESLLFSRITEKGLEELLEKSRKSFADTFSPYNTEEDMKLYLEESFTTQKLLNELQNPHSEFYFASNQGETVGYIKVNVASAQTEWKDSNGLELERIYVWKEFQGAGYGKALLEKAIQFAVDRRKDFLWLGVWEKNDKAIRFYEKHGFVCIGSHDFLLGKDLQKDLLMRLDLK
jgi:diamine N-acetyltransferase